MIIMVLVMRSIGHFIKYLQFKNNIFRYMWSSIEKTSTHIRSPTFVVLHHDGSIEVFDVRKKTVLKKPTEEKSLTHVGLLTIANIKGLLKEEGIFRCCFSGRIFHRVP